nr:substrate-binding domain-containing protein [Spelaeicoccus albus]
MDVTLPPQSERTVSIRDVAKLAQVSYQTVSRVLNGSPSVRPATRQRVLDAVVALDFRPNRAARALAGRRSYTIGVLATVSPAYYGPSSTMRGIEDAARDRGYSVLLANSRGTSAAELSAMLNHLVYQGVEGIIVLAPQAPAAHAATAMRKPVPVVMTQHDGGDPELSANDELGGEMAARHLWELGHRRLGHVAGPADWSETDVRRRGFEKALAEVGSAPIVIGRGDWSADSGYEAFENVARHGVTGVFCANDQMALGFVHAAVDRGLNVPNDLSVVGFDGVPEAAHYLPALTTMYLDFVALGRRAVERLLVILRDGETAAHGAQEPILPQLIVRDSTARVSAA